MHGVPHSAFGCTMAGGKALAMGHDANAEIFDGEK